jgi:hypothetical protein
VPRDRVRMHVCWGNYEGPHDCDVPLETIWPVIRQANVGGFVLPFANARHAHEFQVFGKLPLADDQVIVAGVIDTLTNFVEHPEVVADRLQRVAATVGDPRCVLGGTDCGFDSTAGQGRVAAAVRATDRRLVIADVTSAGCCARRQAEALPARSRPPASRLPRRSSSGFRLAVRRATPAGSNPAPETAAPSARRSRRAGPRASGAGSCRDRCRSWS